MASTTIDSKVVEMRFDNSKFESGVKESLSTLDKLKAAISNLKGNNLEINASDANNKMGVLHTSVGTITNSFSALGEIATGALRRIGEQAVDAGEKLLKSLSVDQIEAGYSKYDQKTQSVQTLVNATGKSVDEINDYLSKLMWYSDETSYSFTEMTSALAQMTSTGGDIENLVPTIMGIANATAYAGKNGQAFVSTIRNLGQSYNAGFLQYLDWKSLVGAGTNSKQLTEELIRAGEELGKIKKGTVTIENFTDTLKNKWADTEVMERAFGRFAKASVDVYDMVESGKFELASEALANLGDDYDQLAKRAFISAQEAKTFQEAIDATKDAVSSGWMDTFELIFGNYEEAKELWTDLSQRMWEFFAGGAEGRNNKLANILSDQWGNITKLINGTGISTERFEAQLEKTMRASGYNIDTIKARWGSLDEFFKQTGQSSAPMIRKALEDIVNGTSGSTEATEKAVRSLEKYQEAINKVFKGEMGTGTERLKKLTEAEYDAAGTQKLINYLWEEGGKSFKRTTITAEDLTKVLGEMSDAELETVGFTKEEIEAVQELLDLSEETGQSLEDLIGMLGKPKGRDLLIETYKNSWDGLVNIINVVKEAFANVFPPKSIRTIYDMIDAVYKASDAFKKMTEDTDKMNKLMRTLQGLFSVLAIIKDVVSFGLTLAWRIFTGTLNRFGYTALDATAKIGDIIYKIKQWIDEQDIINKLVDKIVPIIVRVVNGIKSLTAEGSLFQKTFVKVKDILTKAYDAFVKWYDGLLEAENIPQYLFETLTEGLLAGITFFIDTLSTVGLLILDALGEALGLGSKSKDKGVYSYGSKAMEDFAKGFKENTKPFVEALKKFGEDMIDTFTNLPWGKIAALTLGVMMVKTTGTFATSVSKLVKILAPVSDLLNSVSSLVLQLNKTIKKVGKSFNAFIVSRIFVSISECLLAMAGALYIINKVVSGDPKTAIQSCVILGIMLGAIAGLLFEIYKLSEKTKKNKISSKTLEPYVGVLKEVAKILLAVAVLGAILSKNEHIDQITGLVTMVFIGLGGILFAMSKITGQINSDLPVSLGILVSIVKSMSLLLIALGISVKLMSGIDETAFGHIEGILIGLGVFIGLLAAVIFNAQTNIQESDIVSFSALLGAIAGSFLIISVAMKILDGISPDGWKKGEILLGAIAAFATALLIFLAVTGLQLSVELKTFSLLMLSIAGSMLMVTLACRAIDGVPVKSFGKATLIFGGLLGIMKIMSKLNLQNTTIKEFSKTMMSMGVAFLTISMAVGILGMMKADTLAKGIAAIGGLAVIITGFLFITQLWLAQGKEAAMAMLGFAGAVDLLVFAVFLLGNMNGGVLLKGEAAVGGLAIIIGLLVKCLNGVNIGNLLTTCIGLSILFGVLAASVALLSFLTPEELRNSEVAIAVIAGALTTVIASLYAVSKADYKGILAGLFGLVAIISIIGITFYKLNKMDHPATILPIAEGMAIAMAAIVGALYVMSIMADKLTKNIAGIGIALAAMAVLMIEIGLLFKSISNYQRAISLDEALGYATIIVALAVVFAVVAAVGSILMKSSAAIGGAAAAIVGFDAFIGSLLLLVGALGAFGKVETFQNAMDILAVIAEGIGRMISGFQSGQASKMPEVGTMLGEFATNAAPFFDYMEKLDINLFDVIYSMADALKVLLGGTFSKGVGGSSDDPSKWENIKEKLVSMAGVIKTFAEQFKDVSSSDMSKLETAATAATHISNFFKNLKLPTEGGVKGFIFGNSTDMDKLAEDIQKLATCMNIAAYHFGGINPENLESGAKAASSFGDVLNSLPDKGGIIEKWIGSEYTLTDLGEDMVAFALKLKEFNQAVFGINHEAVQKAAYDAKAIAKVLDALPEKDSKFNDWFGGGTTTLDDFGSQLGKLGSGLYSFSNSAKEIDEDAMDKGIKGGQGVADIAATLKGTEASLFSKEGTLGSLADNLVPFGEHLVEYYNSISTITPGIMSTITPQIKGLIDVLVLCKEIDKGSVDDFRIALESFSNLDLAGVIKAFSKDGLTTLKTSFLTIMDAFKEGIESRYDEITDSFNFLFTYMVNSFHDNKRQFYDVGVELNEQLRSGIKFGEASLEYAASMLVMKMKTAISNFQSQFYGAGQYLAFGLRDGIDAGSGEAVAAAKRLGEATLKQLQDSLKEASPSKASRQMGMFLDMGLVQGIDGYSKYAVESAEALGEDTLYGLSNVMDGVSDLIDWDLNPVITPTLDLSYVEASASALDGMLNGSKIGVNGNIQNGGVSGTNGANTINFTQNNYSPKALNRIDIYRNTNNQISRLKGAMG